MKNQRAFGSMLCSERMSFSRSICPHEACVFFLRFESAGTGYKSDFSQKLCGNGEKPSRRVYTPRGEELDDGCRRDLFLDAVDPQPRHHPSEAKAASKPRTEGRCGSPKPNVCR